MPIVSATTQTVVPAVQADCYYIRRMLIATPDDATIRVIIEVQPSTLAGDVETFDDDLITIDVADDLVRRYMAAPPPGATMYEAIKSGGYQLAVAMLQSRNMLGNDFTIV